MNNSRMLATGYLLIVMLLAGACTGITSSDRPAVSKWWLEPYAVASQPARSDSPVSAAIRITVVPGLDTDRILTLSGDAELGQFASARWVDSLPELLTSLLGRSLQATGRFEIVSESVASRPGNCLLELEFREFFADIGPGGITTGVRIAAHGRYQCGSDTMVAVHSSVSRPITNERMNVIVAAFQQAMDQMTQEILKKIY